MKKKNISLKENPLGWYTNLTAGKKIIVLLVMITVMGLVVIYGLRFVSPDYERTSLREGSLLDRTRSFPSLLEKERSLPSLLTRVKREEYPITLEGILCDNLFKYNMTNMTWGSTTCIKAEYFNMTDINYDCICYTPIG